MDYVGGMNYRDSERRLGTQLRLSCTGTSHTVLVDESDKTLETNLEMSTKVEDVHALGSRNSVHQKV